MKYAIPNTLGGWVLRTDSIEVLPVDAIPLTDAQYIGLGDGTLAIVEGAVVAAITIPPSAIKSKLDSVDVLYAAKFYSNTTALFPSGTKVIQLRSETDFRSFERVVLAAITRQAAQRENAVVDFRTEDNVTQTLPASEFIPVALDILDAKQAIWKVRTAHKDAINDLTEEEAALYDETAGWPETNEPVWVMEERASKIYKGMIRRRADRLVSEGETVAALALLKTIGE